MIVYFDLETGGVEPHHPTIQLAAIAVDGGIEISAFEQKIRFNEADCDPAALAINHYTAEAWKESIPRLAVVTNFAAWLRPYCAVEKKSKAGKPYQVARGAGYNAVSFDWPRLRALFGTQFLPVDYLVRDVLQRVLFYADENGEAPDNFKLSTVAAWLGLDVSGAHDALFDVRLCWRVHQEIVGKEEW